MSSRTISPVSAQTPVSTLLALPPSTCRASAIGRGQRRIALGALVRWGIPLRGAALLIYGRVPHGGTVGHDTMPKSAR